MAFAKRLDKAISIMNKQDEIKFQKAIELAILDNGGGKVAEEHGSKRFIINTKAGILNLSLPEPSGDMFTIFGRFEDPAVAFTAGIQCRSFSGKYNFHISDYAGRTVEEVITLGIEHITETL